MTDYERIMGMMASTIERMTPQAKAHPITEDFGLGAGTLNLLLAVPVGFTEAEARQWAIDVVLRLNPDYAVLRANLVTAQTVVEEERS